MRKRLTAVGNSWAFIIDKPVLDAMGVHPRETEFEMRAVDNLIVFEPVKTRVEEIFQHILEDVQRSGYDGLLPAGIVLTGGSALLRGITEVAERVLNVPARVAQPQNLVGMVDKLHSPAYATSVGLLHWAMSDNQLYQPRTQNREWGRKMGSILKALLPG